MLCREILEEIEKDYPAEAALSWDNVGLLVGREDKEVRRIYVALDAGDEVIARAAKGKADMLVTHHPVIFAGLKRVVGKDFVGRRVMRLIQEDIACCAIHTNYDVRRMAILAGERLELRKALPLEITDKERGEGIGRIADLEGEASLEEYAAFVKQKFGLNTVKIFGDRKRGIRRVSLCPGSGKSVLGAALLAGADVLVTGDIDYHAGTDAAAQGLAVIDAGHYGLEYIFMEDMKAYFESRLKGVEAESLPLCQPFDLI